MAAICALQPIPNRGAPIRKDLFSIALALACWVRAAATMRSMTPNALNEALGHSISDKRLAVLRWVEQCGSISQAAREVGISYKAAWQAIDTLTSLSGAALVERTVGGTGGGGAQITAEGLRLLALADELASARQRVLAQFADGAALAGGLGLRTSMRNQLPCTVTQMHSVDEAGPLVSAGLRTPGGQMLQATLTRESADLLGLRVGLEVLTLCKATAVHVCARESVDAASEWAHGRCALRGMVARISAGTERDEVSLALPGGGHWVGFAERPWRAVVGEEAVAWVASSALVIGLG
jgi:molybdate transport system regulatory protein